MGRKRIIALGGGIIALVVAAGIILRSECREKMSKELFSFRRLYIYIYRYIYDEQGEDYFIFAYKN